jgi:hypothetical protein
MRGLALSLTLLAATFAAACGNSGSAPPPPPPSGNYSNASLKGQYAFSMSGQNSNGFFARVGAFTADGGGNITGGVEDVNTATTAQTLPFTNSTYSILPNGRGTITLTNSTGSLVFSIALNSTTQGFIVETDGIATASGSFSLQNPGSFSLSAVSGNYVFDVSGLDPSGNPDSIIGQFQASGGGTIVTGVLDENDGATPSGPLPFSSGTYQIDATYGSTYGRGSVTFAGLTYVFYIVDGSRLRFMETNSSALTIGDALAQANTVPATNAGFTGSFAFLLGGSSLSGPLARAGRFTSNGNGGLTSILLDDNNTGSYTPVPKGTITAATYAIDSAYPGSGRGTATFTDSSAGTFQFIFYLVSPNQAVFQDNSKGMVADGILLSQTGGPFSNATLSGNFVFDWSGISSNSSTGVTAEEDFVGQFALSSSSSNNVSGAMDFSEFSSNQGVFLNIGIAGGLTLNGDATSASGNRNTFSVKTSNSPSTTLNFTAYVVNPNTIFLVGVDSTRVIAGTLSRQN